MFWGRQDLDGYVIFENRNDTFHRIKIKVFNLFLRLIVWCVKCMLALRYKIEVEHLEDIKNGGIVFLPNHPAEIDPLILFSLLYHRFAPSPLVVEHFYYLKGAYFFMRLAQAIPIPSFEAPANQWQRKQVERALNKIAQKLQAKQNCLVYPAGRLKQKGREIIGGSSFVHRLLEACPDVQIVLVRITGLWGSSFSRALTGNTPDFWRSFLKGVKIVLKNGVFFTPKRKVKVEFSKPPLNFPLKGSRLEFNHALETWYNRYLNQEGHLVDQEPLTLVSWSRWKRDYPLITHRDKENSLKQTADIPLSLRQDVYQELAKMTGRRLEEICDTMELSADLGLDSLDLGTLYAVLDDRYEIEGGISDQVIVVGDLFQLILKGKKRRTHLDDIGKKGAFWPEENNRPLIGYGEGSSLQEVFFSICERMGRSVACADQQLGIITYREMKLKTLVLAGMLKSLPDLYVGVLLPSSVSAYLVILALLIAGKIPVILNWTAGARNLNSACSQLKLKTLISSRLFLQRAHSVDLGACEDKICLLEDLKLKLSLFDRLKALLLACKTTRGLIKYFHLKDRENDPALILFTSGTESYPKAVPLSHRNLITNQKSVLEAITVYKDDIFYGVLPPFHSFGLSLTGLLPLFMGLRVFYAPDPTDSYMIARDCYRLSITILCFPPSFYRNLFRTALKGELKTVRLFVSGAEKASPDLFDYVKGLDRNKQMIEGYGITECSPAVSIMRQNLPLKGVGKPLSCVEICIIDPETQRVLQCEESGEICIRGENVFQGYLGKNITSPFIDINQKSWYRSGDIGYLDREGFLFLKGRLKRFIKIGAEMVSLAALEEELTKWANEHHLMHSNQQGPYLTIGVTHQADRPLLILFTTFTISKEDVNVALREIGFGRIVKIAAIVYLDEIPMTGAGKVHDHRIQQLAQDVKIL